MLFLLIIFGVKLIQLFTNAAHATPEVVTVHTKLSTFLFKAKQLLQMG
jgi:hypothetical protein